MKKISKIILLLYFLLNIFSHSYAEENFFNKNNYEIETKIFKDCEHRIPMEGSSLGLQFIKKHLY